MVSDEEVRSTPRRHIVITVHGIRTLGKSQERLANLLAARDDAVHSYPYKYGFFSVLAFLFPPLRFLRVRQFRKTITDLIAANPGCEISIVGHSFGTHMIGRALSSSFDLKPGTIKQVILSGSVLKSNFDWQRLIQQRVVDRVINDCGADDKVLLLSQFCVLLTGMAGRIGFFGLTGPNLVNRFFRGGHSHYFLDDNGQPSDRFMERYWLPLLIGNEQPRPLDERPDVGAASGVKLWMIQNADAPKVAVLAAVSVLAWQSLWALPREQVQLRLDLAKDNWVVSALADGSLRAVSPPPTTTDEDRIGGLRQEEFDAAIEKLSKIDNLSELHISGGHVKNLDSIRKIPYLKSFYISGENLFNIDGIKYLTKLETLSITRASKVVSLESLKNLHSLKNLSLYGFYGIRDINSISGLFNLENLDIGDMKNLESIYPIKNLKNLKIISFFGLVKIKNISGLCDIKNLRSIDMRENDLVSSLESIRNCQSLSSLDISENDGIVDLTPISDLKNLKYLYMRNTDNIKTLYPIKNMNLVIEDASTEQMRTLSN